MQLLDAWPKCWNLKENFGGKSFSGGRTLHKSFLHISSLLIIEACRCFFVGELGTKDAQLDTVAKFEA